MAKKSANKKQTKSRARKRNPVIQYLSDTRAELRKVHWPSRNEAWNLTRIVLVVTFGMAIFLGVLDWLFDRELEGILQNNAYAIGALIVVGVASVLLAVILGRQQA